MSFHTQSPVRRSVSLISGPSAIARARYIRMRRACLASRAEPSAVSLWLQAGSAPSAPAEAPVGLQGPDRQLLAGCICCLGGSVFRATLVRLLRQKDWQHLYLEVDEQESHLLQLVQQLRSPPFDQHLRLLELVRVESNVVPVGAPGADRAVGEAADDAAMTSTAAACWPSSPSFPARHQAAGSTGWASVTARLMLGSVVRDATVATAAGSDRAVALRHVADLCETEGQSWHWQYHDPLLVPWSLVQESDPAAAGRTGSGRAPSDPLRHDVGTGSMDAFGSTGPTGLTAAMAQEGAVQWLLCCWPADDGLPTRQEALTQFDALVALPGVLMGRAVLQTVRGAYDVAFRMPAGSVSRYSEPTPGESVPIGRSGRDLSTVLRSRETAWRLDNRLLLCLTQGMDWAASRAAVQALQGLYFSGFPR
ncbi:MAG: hypothetical protein Q4A16_00255 [Lautropia sp.]|nr:hypothetical protein [Lautropia sp.]